MCAYLCVYVRACVCEHMHVCVCVSARAQVYACVCEAQRGLKAHTQVKASGGHDFTLQTGR